MTVPNTPGSHSYGDPQAGGGYQQPDQQQGWAPSAYSASAPGQESYGYAPQGYAQVGYPQPSQPSGGFGAIFSTNFTVAVSQSIAKITHLFAIVAGIAVAAWGIFDFIAVVSREYSAGTMDVISSLVGAFALTIFGLFLPAISRMVIELAVKPGENNRA